MNAALITVALAGMSFGGFTFITGTGAPSATPSNGGAVPVVVPEDAEKQASNQEEPGDIRFEFSIEELKFVDAFGDIAEAFDLVPALSATMLKRYKNHDPIVTLAGEYTLNEAMDRLLVFDPYGVNSNAYYIEDGKVSITDPMVVIRKETSIKTYSLAWADRNTAKEVYITLREVVGNGKYPQFFEASSIGNQLAVNARKQAHEQIDNILADAKAAYEKSVDEEQATKEQAIKSIQAELNRVRTELILKKTMIKELESKLKVLTNAFDPELSTRRHDREISELEKALVDTELFHEEYRSRYNYLRDSLIESEYTAMFKGLE